jgi:hypothetical protein
MINYKKKLKIYLPFFYILSFIYEYFFPSYNKGTFNNKVFQLFMNPKNKGKIKIFRLESILWESCQNEMKSKIKILLFPFFASLQLSL